MMNKWIIYFLSLYCFCSKINALSSQEEIEAIEKEIYTLKEQLHQDQLQQMKEDVESQEFMLADWKTYAQKVEMIRQKENQSDQIEQTIKNLEQHRDKLIQQTQERVKL